MNEKYGIELELITNKFKEKVQQIKNTFKDIKNEKIDMSKQVKINNIKREFELASNQAEALRNKLKLLKNELSKKQDWEIETKSYARLQNDINKTTLQFEKASIKVDNLNDKLSLLGQKDLSSSFSKGTDALTKGLNKITSKIKKFGLSLLSIRSIWSLVSRASSAYLTQDTELAEKLQSAWAGLGSMLAPIIEKIANVLIKGVAYINIFIKALTGVDLLAKASAKSMAKATKSAKGLNKALAGFDELNNIDSDIGSNVDTGISNPFESIQDTELPWANRIKEFGEWVKNNMPLVTGILTGLVAVIASAKLTPIASTLGLIGKSYLFLRGLGIAVAIYGIIELVKDLTDYLKIFDGNLVNNGTTFKDFGKIVQDVGLIILGIGVAFLGLPAIITGACIVIFGIITQYRDKILNGLQIAYNWLASLQENFSNWFIQNLGKIQKNFGLLGVGIVGSIVGTINYAIELVKGAIQAVMHIITGLTTGFKQVFDGILMLFRGNFKQGFTSIAKGIANIFIGIINGVISGINAMIYPIRALVVAAGKVTGKNWSMSTVSIPKIPYLNVGTNYVPEDQLAYIHKGEAVIPKKFNSQEYFNGNSEKTNHLLQEVIGAIERIEIKPYTTVKDIGYATETYFKDKKRQTGKEVFE